MLFRSEKLIDAISSWWCVIHGYSHPAINAVAKNQIDHFSHVMLGGLTHQPAKLLSEKLKVISPQGLDHVFFSDSGSVGVEVALKMAIQFWKNKNFNQKNRIGALAKAYHGDTCGAMSVGDPEEGMHALFQGIVPEQLFVDSPTHGFIPDRDQLILELERLEAFFVQNHLQLAAFIVEPLMQAAGGFVFYSPEYLRRLRKLCDDYQVLLIFDEVATGFGRTGTLFAADQVGISPDLMVLGKGLTAGYVGLAATLASDEIFQAFYADEERKAFMHGPTFMGNALACSIALKSIALFEDGCCLEKIKKIETILQNRLLSFVSSDVKNCRVLGATGVIEVNAVSSLEGIQEYAKEQGVWLRPFDRYLYTMPPYIITEKELHRVLDVMIHWFLRKN